MIAGIGLRETATAQDILAALDLAPAPLAGIATLEGKAALPALRHAAGMRGLSITALPRAAIQGIATPTQSPRQLALFATGSLAEAAALVAAGPGATLHGPRLVLPGGAATIAFASKEEP